MKAMLVLAVIFVVAWIWRSARSAPNSSTNPSTKSSALPVSIDMLACLHCGVHVVDNEAVMGKRGAYCSAGHRAAAEP